MEDYERAHLLEQYYLMEQEWQHWEEYNRGRRSSGFEKSRVNNVKKNEWAFRAKQCNIKKGRGRKAKY